MNPTTLFGLCGAALVGIGLYGLLTDPRLLRKIIAFNLVGSGVFLLFGVVARRGAGAGLGGDPVPQALVLTSIVIGLGVVMLLVALTLRIRERYGTLDGDQLRELRG